MLERLLELLPGYSYAVIDDDRMAYDVEGFDLLDQRFRNVLLRFGPSEALAESLDPLTRAI